MFEVIAVTFAKGGPYMFGVLGLGVLSMVGCLASGALFGWKRLLSALLGAFFIVLPLAVGIAGTIHGLVLTERALELCDPTMVDQMRSSGTRFSMYPTYLAVAVAGVSCCEFLTVALFSAAVARRGEAH